MPPRHLPFALILCRHSEFPAFLWLTSLPLRASSSSPHIAVINHLALISIPASRESGVLSCVWKNPQAELPRTRQRFYRAMGSLRGACLHIPRGREGAREKRATARWGVCKATTGASPRNPQLAIIQTKPNFKPLQNQDFCRNAA